MSDLPAQPAPPASSAPEGTSGPLGPLAISLSGGGYRAAAFHLGTFRLLHDVGLLDDVVGLSTVSGGSIVGMAWTLSLVDGVSFADFETQFSGFIQRTNVIRQAMDGLVGRRSRHQGELPSLIRSAADVYADPGLFGERLFGELLDADFQLQEAIFNSTEFHTGMDFRFRRSDKRFARIGNGSYRVHRGVARHIRLADIVAASSCFPGGFEPLVFPQQFHWPAEYPLETALRDLGPKYGAPGLPLMDGGIYDNQGVESLLVAFERTPARTLLISDVSAPEKNIYNVPPPPRSRGFLTLERVSLLGWVVFVLALVSLGVLGLHAAAEHRAGELTGLDVVVYGFVSVLMVVLAGGLAWARRLAGIVEEKIEQGVGIHAWPTLRRLTVPEVVAMGTLRAGSLLKLTSSIFMQRVRQLVYDHVYTDKKYKGRRMANLIFVLTIPRPKLYGRFPWLQPGATLLDKVNHAVKMGTTLWFDEHVRFDTLVTVGRASVCFVLLEHIIHHHPGFDAPGTPLNDLFLRLKDQWMTLNA